MRLCYLATAENTTHQKMSGSSASMRCNMKRKEELQLLFSFLRRLHFIIDAKSTTLNKVLLSVELAVTRPRLT